LMAAMNVKHGFVRAFGLAGKIVILDEVHTYDSYTGTILDALVELLVSLECTVLILSATLSSQRRKQILGRTLKGSKAYPMVTAAPRCKDLSEVSLEPPPSRTFEIQMQHETALAIEESLRCAEQGQQVLWIENTVKEAQSVYLNLAARAAEIGVECGLIHSRFTQDHRAFHEDKWVSLYGKDGWSNRVGRGRVLVGTQVLEQSLDIDSDFLVSRFAPTDLLLQRLGRLWRHPNTPRPKGARCRAWWLAPDLGPAVEKPEVAFGPSAFVYSPYVLCRSLEIWEGKLGLSLPQDLRPLVEATYVDREESGQMSRWKQELETGTQRRQGVRALRQLASLTLSEGGVTLSDTETATRYSESESIDVLLLNRLELNPSSKETSFTTVDGAQEVIPWRRHLLSKKGWRKLSVMLMRQVVAIRPAEAPPPLPMETLKKFGLQHCFYLGSPEHTEATLRVALVKRNGQLTHPFGEVLPNWEYRSDLGYRMTSTHGGR
jgi:CRISPR-associated endonuclease/helicase Cas3